MFVPVAALQGDDDVGLTHVEAGAHLFALRHHGHRRLCARGQQVAAEGVHQGMFLQQGLEPRFGTRVAGQNESRQRAPILAWQNLHGPHLTLGPVGVAHHLFTLHAQRQFNLLDRVKGGRFGMRCAKQHAHALIRLPAKGHAGTEGEPIHPRLQALARLHGL